MIFSKGMTQAFYIPAEFFVPIFGPLVRYQLTKVS